MAPRFVEISNPLESAARSQAASFFTSLNTSIVVDNLYKKLNLTDSSSKNLEKVGNALKETATTFGSAHYILLGALLLFALNEVLIRFSVKRALKRRFVPVD